MLPKVPENINEISDEELSSLDESITSRVDELGETDPAELSDEEINEIEALAEIRSAVDGEHERRAGARIERTERASSALAKARGSMSDQAGEPGDDDEADDEAEADEADDEAEAGDEPVEAATEEADEPLAVVASAKKLPAVPKRGTTAGLSRRRPQAAAPRQTKRGAFMNATAHAVAVPESSPFRSPADVAAAIVRKRQTTAFSNVPAGVSDERVPIATGMKDISVQLGHDAVENFSVLERSREEYSSLVASGSFCTPLTPLYDFYRLAEAQTPVEDGLNVVGAQRGGIRFITGVCDVSVAASGLGTNADPKPCVHIDCPTVQEETVDAISQCVEFGNLQYRTFPEQVENFLEDLAVAFASRKEVYYLDFINTNSTATTSAIAYGASRALLWDWTVAAVRYRKRRGMPRGATVQLVTPDWALDAVRLDMALEANKNFWEISDAQALKAISDAGLDPIWYNDAPTAHSTGADNQKVNGAQGAGTLLGWPGVAVSYLFAPGTFVRLDGGTLDVGLVRDSTLNKTNDLQLFMEEWVGMAMLGCESVKVVSDICVNGGAPELVAALACA